MADLNIASGIREGKGHTPGPWSIRPGANSHCFDGRVMAGEKCVAFVEGDQWLDAEYDHHINAAPDSVKNVPLGIMKARAAILKATGGPA